MNDLISKERTRDLLMNWRNWSRDCPPDPAEVCYYTESPMFTDILPKGTTPPYDNDSALMVEEVLRVMSRPYPCERALLIAYFAKRMTQDEIGKILGVHRTTVTKHRLPMAERIFAEQWAVLIRRDKI